MSQQNRNHTFGDHVRNVRTAQTHMSHHFMSALLARVHDIFGNKFDDDVIKLILEESNWKGMLQPKVLYSVFFCSTTETK